MLLPAVREPEGIPYPAGQVLPSFQKLNAHTHTHTSIPTQTSDCSCIIFAVTPSVYNCAESLCPIFIPCIWTWLGKGRMQLLLCHFFFLEKRIWCQFKDRDETAAGAVPIMYPGSKISSNLYSHVCWRNSDIDRCPLLRLLCLVSWFKLPRPWAWLSPKTLEAVFSFNPSWSPNSLDWSKESGKKTPLQTFNSYLGSQVTTADVEKKLFLNCSADFSTVSMKWMK